MPTKRMLIDAAHPEETRVVVVDGSRLEEYDVEVASRRQLKGNIYLAKITRVEPSLQAAFVDYGGNRHGFLAFNEIHTDYYQIPVADRERLLAEEAAAVREAEMRAAAEENEDGEGGLDEEDDIERRHLRLPSRHYKIQEVIKRRQIMLVQVAKEERGNKGAALTTYLSLAGRYCVLMPNTARGGGISRKITTATDRKRLKKILTDLEVPEGMAVIVRTAGAGRSKAEIKRDYEYLMRLWSSIREYTLTSTAPSLVYEEGNLIKRSIRDHYERDIEEITIQGEPEYKTAREFMKLFIPSHAKRVKLYEQSERPLFQASNIEDQLDAMHQPVVQLRSGGYLVINPTEALVTIDVNSGRATRERHIEETALRTNLEAADEIARQLRLRDLAGLIVIDFIDMEVQRNQGLVERRLKEAMKGDRARTQIGRISPFGLLELSRQRLRPSLLETSFEICSHCRGTGVRRSTESTALAVLRKIEEEGSKHRAAEISVAMPSVVAMYLANQKRRSLIEIEDRFELVVTIQVDETLIPPECRIERIRPVGLHAEEAITETTEVVVTEDVVEVAGERDDGGKRGRRRRGRRRRRVDEDVLPLGAVADADAGSDAAMAELDDLADDEDEDEATEIDLDGDDADDEVSVEGGGDPSSEPTKKRRRRGKRGGRRRSRRSNDRDVGMPLAGEEPLDRPGAAISAVDANEVPDFASDNDVEDVEDEEIDRGRFDAFGQPFGEDAGDDAEGGTDASETVVAADAADGSRHGALPEGESTDAIAAPTPKRSRRRSSRSRSTPVVADGAVGADLVASAKVPEPVAAGTAASVMSFVPDYRDQAVVGDMARGSMMDEELSSTVAVEPANEAEPDAVAALSDAVGSETPAVSLEVEVTGDAPVSDVDGDRPDESEGVAAPPPPSMAEDGWTGLEAAAAPMGAVTDDDAVVAVVSLSAWGAEPVVTEPCLDASTMDAPGRDTHPSDVPAAPIAATEPEALPEETRRDDSPFVASAASLAAEENDAGAHPPVVAPNEDPALSSTDDQTRGDAAPALTLAASRDDGIGGQETDEAANSSASMMEDRRRTQVIHVGNADDERGEPRRGWWQRLMN